MAKIKDGFQGSRAIVLPQSIVAEMEQDPFQSKLHITDIGYYPQARFHYRRRKVGISQYVLIYCVKGRGWFEVGGRNNQIEPNQFFILPAFVPHTYAADEHDPWSIYWIHFKGELAEFYARGFDKPTMIPKGELSRIGDRIDVFEEMFSTLENGYGNDNLNYAISSLYYFLGTIKYIGQFRESDKREHSKDVIDRSISYMREHIEERLSLAELSAAMGYSASYYSDIFRRRTGFSPMQYYIQLKMQSACRLLDLSDIKINQICYKVGIDDPYYFTRIFKKTMGFSPSDYRNNKKG